MAWVVLESCVSVNRHLRTELFLQLSHAGLIYPNGSRNKFRVYVGEGGSFVIDCVSPCLSSLMNKKSYTCFMCTCWDFLILFLKFSFVKQSCVVLMLPPQNNRIEEKGAELKRKVLIFFFSEIILAKEAFVCITYNMSYL